MIAKQNHYLGAALAVLGIALYLSAFFTLNSAIEWPASLRFSGEKLFPMLLANESAVFRGYYFYLLSSLLWIPMFLALRAALSKAGDANRVYFDWAAAFAVAGSVAKALGIVRWLFAMPGLALAHQAAGASESAKESAILIFNTLNLYAGKVGEHLGVGLLSSATLCAFGFGMLQARRGRWLGVVALIFALINLPWRDYLPQTPGLLLVVSANLLLIFFLLLAVWLIREAGRQQSDA